MFLLLITVCTILLDASNGNKASGSSPRKLNENQQYEKQTIPDTTLQLTEFLKTVNMFAKAHRNHVGIAFSFTHSPMEFPSDCNSVFFGNQ